MTVRRLPLLAAVAWLGLAPAANAVTLNEAIAAAMNHAPSLQRAAAERAVARAQVQEARAGQRPTLTLQGAVATAPTDFGHFFGFPSQTLTPSSAAIELRQHLFDGGAAAAAVAEARAGVAGADFNYASTRFGLAASVAEVFEAVRVSERALVLRRRQAAELGVVAEQAKRKFDKGEVPSTDVDAAKARLAGARADLAQAEGDAAVAAARYEAVVGEPPEELSPPVLPGDVATNVNDAVALAEAHNTDLAAAAAALTGADEAMRQAKAGRAPTLDFVAGASSVRDEFLPGYRADAATIGVQGRWAIVSGGLVNGRIAEATARRGAVQASLDQTRNDVRETAIEAWHTLVTARAVATAAAAQATAADAALASVKEEVRVGEKPTLDLLDAEREALAADLAELRAEAASVVATYRLRAVTAADAEASALP